MTNIRVNNTALKKAYDEMSRTVDDVNDQIDAHKKKTDSKIRVFIRDVCLLQAAVSYIVPTTNNLNLIAGFLTAVADHLILKEVKEENSKSDQELRKEIRTQLSHRYSDNDIEMNRALFGEEKFSEIAQNEKKKGFQWSGGKVVYRKKIQGVAMRERVVGSTPKLGWFKQRTIDKITLDSFEVVKKRYDDLKKEKPLLFRYLPSFLRIHLTVFYVLAKEKLKGIFQKEKNPTVFSGVQGSEINSKYYSRV